MTPTTPSDDLPTPDPRSADAAVRADTARALTRAATDAADATWSTSTLGPKPSIFELFPGADAPLKPALFRAAHVWETVDTNDGGEITRCCACGTEFDSVQANYACPHAEHPHAGRIAAVAHLSAAMALIDCAGDALDEAGIDRSRYFQRIAVKMEQAADEIMEPCEIANVLQTVEEFVSGETSDLTDVHVTRRGREQIVRALVDARQAAKEDERDEQAHDTHDEGYNAEPGTAPAPGQQGRVHGLTEDEPRPTEPNPSNYREDDHA